MSTGSSRSGTDWTNTVPPPSQVRKLIQWPAPCMNGGASSACSPVLASATNSSIDAAVFEPPKHSTIASPLRHMTPLGIPVVPPV
jgi:hypothetical protein